MLAVRIVGGLGNQLFQYAASRLLADRLGTGLLLDTRGLARVAHPYRLTAYDVRAREASPMDLRRWPAWHRRSVGVMGAKLGVPTRWYEERGLHYDERFWRCRDGTYLIGYFQSERYFAGQEAKIRSELRLREPPPPEIAELAGRASASQSVALHVRRGDYVTNNRAAQVHGACSERYYDEASRGLRERHPDARFFVFSDDPAWCRSRLLGLGADAVYVAGNAARPELDLYLMSRCRHHIISNSSFSWWGAWLAEWPGQEVTAPEPWFDDPTLNSADLVPARWRRLPK